ncbi:HAD family hydrolase [Streptomyces aculeolatus]
MLLTSDPLDAEAALTTAGLPAPVLHLSGNDIPARGSGACLRTAADRLNLRTNRIVMVGTSEWDWRTASTPASSMSTLAWPTMFATTRA